MHEDYEQLLKLTPEEMAVQILEKRRLLADQISFIIQGLEESVDQLQQKYDKITPKLQKRILFMCRLSEPVFSKWMEMEVIFFQGKCWPMEVLKLRVRAL